MKGERALSREAWCAWKSVRAGPAARAKALRQEELGPATEVKEGRRGPACEGGAAEQRREQGRAGPRGSPSAARRMRPRRQQQDVAGGSPEEGHRGGGGAGLAGLLGVQSQPPPHGRLLPGCPRPAHPEPTASCLCPLCRLLTQQCACRGGHAGGREHWCHLELHVPGLRGERESGSPPEGVLLGPVSFLGVWPRRGTFCVVSAGKRRAHLRPWVGRVGRGSQWTCVASKAGRK